MSDFDALAGIDQGLYALSLIATAVPALKIGQLVRRQTRAALMKSACWNVCFVCLPILVLMIQAVNLWTLYNSFGWEYINDKLAGFLPLALLPASVMLTFSVPRLLQIARGQFEPAEEQIGEHGRMLASAPELIVPIQTAALGSLMAAVLQFTTPSVTLEPTMLVAAWGILVTSSSMLWIHHSWRQHRFVHQNGPIRRRFWFDFVIPALVLLILFIGTAFWFYQATAAGFSTTSHTKIERGMKHMSVADLTGPRTGKPDRRFTLIAQKSMVRLPSGKTIEAWTFNGQYPGPDLHMKQGDLVEVVLENKDIPDGVTIHWHGLHVPNAEDGAAGVTQDAVLPGEKHIYRFVAKQAGTYWYHSDLQSSNEVEKGLLGAIVIDTKDRREPIGMQDMPLVFHKIGKAGQDAFTWNGSDTLLTKKVPPGTTVRLRIINADSYTATLQLQGTPFHVAAIDGSDLNEPNLIANQALKIAAGGRYDVVFTMPKQPVYVTRYGTSGNKGLLLSPDGSASIPALAVDISVFDPSRYGNPEPLPFDSSSHFNRAYQLVFDGQLVLNNGRLEKVSAINGKLFPNLPELLVKEGDLVKITFVNRSCMDQSVQLHGHRMLVLTRNGHSVSGSPWWTDALNVAPGEIYEAAFRADNPGLWMNGELNQASSGISVRLIYEGVTTPYPSPK